MMALLWLCALVYSLGVVLLVLRVQSNAARISRLESQQKHTLELFEIEISSQQLARKGSSRS